MVLDCQSFLVVLEISNLFSLVVLDLFDLNHLCSSKSSMGLGRELDLVLKLEDLSTWVREIYIEIYIFGNIGNNLVDNKTINVEIVLYVCCPKFHAISSLFILDFPSKMNTLYYTASNLLM